MEYPIYEVIFDPNKDKGIYALSVVQDPAMESMFVALKKDEQVQVKLAEVNAEQRILLGVALIPNKPIYRNQDGKEFYITFPEDTIKLAAHSFIKNHYNGNSSIEHEVQLSGVSVVESWIVEDVKNDKSNTYGLEAPKGSWVAMMKVDNQDLWDDYVKTGKIKGFSIDGLFSLNKLELNKEQMSESKTTLEVIKEGFKEIKALFSSQKEETQETETTTVELSQDKLKDGTVVEFEGEKIEVGTALFIVGEEGSTPAPDGEHELEDGRKVTVADGVVSEISVEVDEDASMEEIEEALAKLSKEVKDEVVTLRNQLQEKDQEIEQLKTQLSETPATKPIKPTETKLSSTPKSLKEAIKSNRK
ncbi:XkdF-like putative serine protease domain-containing protein [Flagellimonas onchidii]|uniref:XkdF-like putative serine protease domain-containing protein n=1 Tax=Flagellimonas onchidii TaxID=2562684 RepID=UPI0010A668DF|nr:XkdF-like putative serine protease domain-containing protein [Allomuricauda onchidii]